MTVLKRRTIQVQDMTCDECERTVERGLGGLSGVQEVHADRRTGTVDIAYDLEKRTLLDLEREIESLGYHLDDGFWTRAKRGWFHFTEENERGNMQAKPSPCCSNALDEIQRRKSALEHASR